MAQYMLLLHEAPSNYDKISPEEVQRVIEKYKAWSEKLRAQGKVLGGNKLREEGGKSLTSANGRISAVDGPYSEAKEIISGYFLIQAASYEEAVHIATECPHLGFGGRIEVREVEPT